jgi:uncharacterized membrane protein YqjE
MGDTEKSLDNIHSSTKGGSLPDLVSRLGEDIVTLLDTKLGLLKMEIKEDVKVFLRSSLSITVGGIILVIGFSLLNIAFAFLVSALFENAQLSQPLKYAFGFIITGAIYLAIGGVVLSRAKNRLAKQDLSPERSLKELEKDKEWLKREF